MDELKMTQEEFEILDRILSGRLHKRERLEVIALIDKEGFSRRPELDEEELIPFLLTLRTFYNKDGDVDLTAISKAICAKFTAPEAKPASSVNAEVVKALNKISESTCMDCTSAMIAEQALNSIKAGKDTKCS